MSKNDIVLLDQILKDYKQSAPTGLSDSQLFELFTSEQVLKDYDLSNDELFEGITGGSGDGGVDGFYVFADENLMDEDSDYSELPSRYSFEIHLMQSKTSVGFTEEGFDKLLVSLPTLLNLKDSIDESIYNERLAARINIFRTLFKSTARKFPEINLYIYYSTKGETTNIDPRVITKARLVETRAKELLGSKSHVKVKFLGARNLLELAEKAPSTTLELQYINNASKLGQNSYIALVPLIGYLNFIKDESGKLKRNIFESNVRDYQGRTPVNAAIRDSLSSIKEENEPDFWWLNNGVTILCTEVTITGDKFIIKDPQVVNGLQTSVSIYEHFKEARGDIKDERSLFVRIITSSDDRIRNKVIVANNSQTNLQPFAIRATDETQHRIERHFFAKNYYYDRRKNYYKNLGKSADKIVTVPYLAQAVLSIGFSEPNNARARPSTILRNETDYRRIFNDKISLEGYLWMAKLQKNVDAYIRQSGLNQDFKGNLRFHLSMLLVHNKLGKKVNHPSELEKIFTSRIPIDKYHGLAKSLKGSLWEYLKEHKEFAVDKVAKSKEFVDFLIEKKVAHK